MEPLIAPVNGRRTSGYGPRNTGIPGASTWHVGIDVGGNPRGSMPDVLSPVAGRVVAVHRRVTDARGKYVIVRGEHASFLVQHLDSIPLRIIPGRTVKIGKKLGVMGATSTVSIALHLHFEVHPHVAGKARTVSDILNPRLSTTADPEVYYPQNGQPRPWERPGEGVTMRPKFKTRHLRLRVYRANRKKVHKLRGRDHRFTGVLSTWHTWTILRNGTFVPTQRIAKEK